jgi:HEPN domain-containing protein
VAPRNDRPFFLVISRAELAALARARLADAEALRLAGRFDSAVYLCGYAVELQLKAAICRTLGWAEFPSSSRDFADLRSFRTHDLRVLLLLTGRKAEVVGRYPEEWNRVSEWNPEMRYTPVGGADEPKARAMLDAATTLLRVL